MKNIVSGNMISSTPHNSKQQSCFSMISLPSLGEMEETVCMLERGTIITKYYPRRRPEQKTLMLRRETRQVSDMFEPVVGQSSYSIYFHS